ncbi:MAG: hypothetical protein LBT42_06030 [Tannerella sp.]|jgi:hypothetical protein|nr:hypothetical protein [Tannerella sp.]
MPFAANMLQKSFLIPSPDFINLRKSCRHDMTERNDGDPTARAVSFLQVAATQPHARFSSCKLQRPNRACGFLPAKCSDNTARADGEGVLSTGATKSRSGDISRVG